MVGGESKPTEDYDFLKINTGWVKQLLKGSHVVDETATAKVTLDTFYDALQSLPE